MYVSDVDLSFSAHSRTFSLTTILTWDLNEDYKQYQCEVDPILVLTEPFQKYSTSNTTLGPPML